MSSLPADNDRLSNDCGISRQWHMDELLSVVSISSLVQGRYPFGFGRNLFLKAMPCQATTSKSLLAYHSWCRREAPHPILDQTTHLRITIMIRYNTFTHLDNFSHLTHLSVPYCLGIPNPPRLPAPMDLHTKRVIVPAIYCLTIAPPVSTL